MFPLRQVIATVRYTTPAFRSMSASTGPLIDLAVDNDGIATLTMQRPPVNSLNLELLDALGKALDDVSDIKRVETFWTTLQEVWLKLFGSNYPTAAAINGHAPAGGCLLSMSCEYRAMVTGKYNIGLNETALGIVAPKWFMDTMCNTISKREAEYALTTARMFNTDEALKVGLIDVLATDKADAVDKCKKFIKKFDKISPIARALTKQKIRAEPLTWLIKNRKQDTDEFLTFVQNPKVQQSLELYIQALKQKSAK